MASNFFNRQRECRFYTAGCGNKMAVSVTGPRAVNELGGPVIPGNRALYSANTKHLYNICTMTAQRLRRWPNIVQILYKCCVLMASLSVGLQDGLQNMSCSCMSL